MVKLLRSCKSFCFFMVTRNSKILLGIIALVLIVFYARQMTAPVHTDFDKRRTSGRGSNDFGPKSPEAYKRLRSRNQFKHLQEPEKVHYTLLPGKLNEGIFNLRRPKPWKPDQGNVAGLLQPPDFPADKSVLNENRRKPFLQIAPPLDNAKQVIKQPQETTKSQLITQKTPPPIKLEPVTQEVIDYIADYLVVSAEIVTNLEEKFFSVIRYTFNNFGTNPIPSGNWEIYLHSLRKLEVKKAPYDDGLPIEGSGLRLFFVDGYLYKLQPNPATFKTILPKTSVAVQLECRAFYISKSDFLPNWYVASEGTKPKVIKSTEGDDLKFVEQIDSPAKWKRLINDTYNPFQPEVRFNLNVDVKDEGGAGSRFVPTPAKIFLDEKSTLVLDPKQWKVVQSVDFDAEAKHLAELFQLPMVPSKTESNYIMFEKVLTTALEQKHTDNEAYSIVINPKEPCIKITANENPGAFYAVKSLFKMSNQTAFGRRVPVGGIVDEPRFSYRGLHLDVSRNFQSKETVLRLLDIMATYKFNKFHMHLSDDEGWRLEIPGLPELTQFASQRCHRSKSTHCLWPQLGSFPESKPPGSGFFTVGDYKEILMFARKRHIQVIPEIDLPGHARAAILAMEDRYKKLKAENRMEEATKYGISDLNDLSGFRSVQGFRNNAFNPCQESSFTFLRHVIKSIKEMHKDIQPLTLFHFGGDEVSKKAWVNSTLCRNSKLVEKNNETESWKEYFFSRILKIAEEEDLSLGAWEDGLINQKTHIPYDKSKFTKFNRDIYGYPWNNIWEYGSGDRAYRLANAGYKVVMSHATHLYFDHPHEPDPEERGLYWATRYIDTRKAWGFIPDHLYWNADVSKMGVPLTKSEVCGENQSCIALQQPLNIVGMECHLWGELLRSQDLTDLMIFPRLLAVAERSWHKASWEDISDISRQRNERAKDWSQFANTVGYRELKYLDSLNIKYRIPVPGAEISEGKLMVNTVFPGLEIQYSRDIGITWNNAQQAPSIKNGENIYLRTMSTDKKRYSRIIKIVHDINKKDVIPQPIRQQPMRFDNIQNPNLQRQERKGGFQREGGKSVQQSNNLDPFNGLNRNVKIASPVSEDGTKKIGNLLNQGKAQNFNHFHGNQVYQSLQEARAAQAGSQRKQYNKQGLNGLEKGRDNDQQNQSLLSQVKGKNLQGQFSQGQYLKDQGQFPQNQDTYLKVAAQLPLVRGQSLRHQNQIPEVQSQNLKAQGQIPKVQGQYVKDQGQFPQVQGQNLQNRGRLNRGQFPQIQGNSQENRELFLKGLQEKSQLDNKEQAGFGHVNVQKFQPNVHDNLRADSVANAKKALKNQPVDNVFDPKQRGLEPPKIMERDFNALKENMKRTKTNVGGNQQQMNELLAARKQKSLGKLEGNQQQMNEFLAARRQKILGNNDNQADTNGFKNNDRLDIDRANRKQKDILDTDSNLSRLRNYRKQQENVEVGKKQIGVS